MPEVVIRSRKNGPNLVVVDGKVVKAYCRCGVQATSLSVMTAHHKKGFQAHHVEVKVL